MLHAKHTRRPETVVVPLQTFTTLTAMYVPGAAGGGGGAPTLWGALPFWLHTAAGCSGCRGQLRPQEPQPLP